MIVVASYPRSGTSLTMNILKDSGYKIHGEKFLYQWEDKIGKHNPNGFYESTLVEKGIKRDTLFALPDRFKNTAVKLLPGGIQKSDNKYIDKLIILIRNADEATQSYKKLRDDDPSDSEMLGENAVTYEHQYLFFYYTLFTQLFSGKLKNVDWMVVDHNKLLQADKKLQRQLKKFLGRKIDFTCINPSLYRVKNVREQCDNISLIDYLKEVKTKIVNGTFNQQDLYMMSCVVTKINEKNAMVRIGK